MKTVTTPVQGHYFYLFIFLLSGDVCTPKVSLTVRPGFLTVNLNRNHSMAHDLGGHLEHRVYYGKEGEPLQVRVLIQSENTHTAAELLKCCSHRFLPL